MANKESNFQSKLIKEIERALPGSVVTKMGTDNFQGMPDLLVLYGRRWALLECKRSENSKHQPNQDYYVDKFNRMSFSAFIYPENKEAVLNELYKSLSS